MQYLRTQSPPILDIGELDDNPPNSTRTNAQNPQVAKEITLLADLDSIDLGLPHKAEKNTQTCQINQNQTIPQSIPTTSASQRQ